MKLKKPVPDPVGKILESLQIRPDDVLICTESDLDYLGGYAEHWLVLTRERLVVAAVDREGGHLVRDIPVKEITQVWTDSRVGSSFLEVQVGGVRREVIRYTNTHASKFATVSKKIRDLVAGREVVITPSDERDVRRCPNCDRMLPEGSSVCPACVKKGAMFRRVMRLMAPYWYLAASLVVVMLIGMGLSMFMPQITRVLMDEVLAPERSEKEQQGKGQDIQSASDKQVGDAEQLADGERPAERLAPGASEQPTEGVEGVDKKEKSEDGEGPPSWFGFLKEATRGLRARMFHLRPEQERDRRDPMLRRSLLALIVGILVLWQLATTGIGLINAQLGTRISNRITYDMRGKVLSRLQQLSVRYHDMNQPGNLMTRVVHDVEDMGGFVSHVTNGFLHGIIMMAFAAVWIFWENAYLALWALIPAPFVLCSTYIYYRYVRPRQFRFYDSRSKLSDVVLASLSGQRVVKAFAQEERELDRFDQYSNRYRSSRIRMDVASATYSTLAGYFFMIGSPIVYWIGGQQVVGGDMTIGKLMAFFGYLGMLYGPMSTLTMLNRWLTQFSTQAHRVFEVMDTEPEIERAPDAVPLRIRGNIEFDHVTFGYDPYNPVLKNITLSIREGEMIGLVGHSGSGKSTFISLLCRFYDPTEGSIRIDGVDLRKIRVSDLRGQIGLVLQEPYLFRGTIAENIAYGRPKASPDAVLEAARAANAHDFITRFADGYDTRLGESGSGLSGGERQRVSIARALLYNPRILILDEATSSVDTVTEREIQKALDVLVKGRTTIAAAHRLSTLQNCDRIVVFEDGYIREEGTHEELMEKKGIYYRMVMIQSQLARQKETVDELTELQKEEQLKQVKAKVRTQV